MKRGYQMYLTDMAPNGTNDLVVLDGDGNVVHEIEEVCFGYPGQRKIKPNYLINCFSPDPNDSYPIYPITKYLLKKHLAISPIDPKGEKMIAKLKGIGAW